ncbi:MAG: nucleotidyltransferase family protein [Leptospira sp.]|nr:nucleotidyltransferase family protein [Leptospira sp.]
MKNNIKVLLLAAGLGTRLKPLTDSFPKCLMPIKGVPLLEIWLDMLLEMGIDQILINTHYLNGVVQDFLNRPKYSRKVVSVYEKELLGTAGTLRQNSAFFQNATTLLIHADNLCICDFNSFLNFHFNERPTNTVMTMMSFQTGNPSSCGILELDSNNIVVKFHEKVKNPPGNLANAAIYLIEPEVTDWIIEQQKNDFSNDVIPHYLGRIATWENKSVLMDIGSPFQLKQAQKQNISSVLDSDDWSMRFRNHKIHAQIESIQE